jgi:hypothetical protein
LNLQVSIKNKKKYFETLSVLATSAAILQYCLFNLEDKTYGIRKKYLVDVFALI